MKQLTFVFMIVIIALLAQFILPWWIISIVCFSVCCIMRPNKFIAFGGSFLAIFVLWYVKAMMADTNFDVPMSSLLGGLFGDISPTAVLFLTGLIGGFVGGLSGLMGSWTYWILYPEK